MNWASNRGIILSASTRPRPEHQGSDEHGGAACDRDVGTNTETGEPLRIAYIGAEADEGVEGEGAADQADDESRLALAMDERRNRGAYSCDNRRPRQALRRAGCFIKLEQAEGCRTRRS